MNRLIDTMTDAAIDEYISYLSYVNQRLDSPRQKLEKLFAPAPHWSDNLDAEDNQTWVLCFVSNASASCTWHTCWICKVNSDGSYGSSTNKMDFLYATPIDLSLRYTKGESDGRVIDAMTDSEVRKRVMWLTGGSLDNLKQDLEALFAPAPHWSDSIAKITGESDG